MSLGRSFELKKSREEHCVAMDLRQGMQTEGYPAVTEEAVGDVYHARLQWPGDGVFPARFAC